MKVVVTCGPSFEPVDEVRRLTNASTGEIGFHLATALQQAGYEVICFRGEAATFPFGSLPTIPFSTNEDLLSKLENLADRNLVKGVFHAAALCDFKISRVKNTNGDVIESSKISSREGALLMELVPAEKVIHRLRDLFPASRIVGWKYELEGSREELLVKAERQMKESQSDACVINGKAYGTGFGFFEGSKKIIPLRDKVALGDFLVGWLTIK